MKFTGAKFMRLVKLILLFYLLIVGVQLFRKAVLASESDIISHLSLNHNVLNSFGIAWLASNLILNGSPVAAIAVGLHSSGIISSSVGISAILGSRVGATAIAFLLGGLYYMRGKMLKRSLSSPTVILLITLLMSAVSLIVGLLLVRSSVFMSQSYVRIGHDGIAEPLFFSLFEMLFRLLGPAYSMVASVLIIIIIAELLEKTLLLPEDKKQIMSTGVIDKIVHSQTLSFLAGLVLTAVFFTVAVSFSLLIPLHASKRITREEMIPYIIGANIGTFSDTALIAFFTGNAETVLLVLACVASNILAAMLLLTWDSFPKRIVGLSDMILATRGRTVAFLLSLVMLPVSLMMLF
ncbi:MAG: hypothetical protein V1921_01165 [Candidatus Altiarchaeota archaeon]